MAKINLNTLVKPKVFWPSIIILLVICFTLYAQKEKEKSLRIAKESELQQTVEAKKVVENNLVDAKKEIVAKDEQIKLSLDKLEKEITARKEAETQLLSVTKEKQVLEARVKELTAALPKQIELEKIVIKTTHELIGKVLAFDKDHAFVVVDLGSGNNLKLGDILSVYRNDKFIGKVQVEKIEEKSAAAAILSPWKNVEFKESDVVKKL
ncbi:MAG: hypothetical protein Q8N62_00900 [Candidatus Omnitrophota bacterium]|nr:hypothetical protein [Candidatus Omnitrophota bacterium]